VAQAFVGFLTAAILGPSGKGVAALAVTIASLGGAALFLSMHVGVVSAHRRGAKAPIIRATVTVALLATMPLLVGLAAGVARVGGGASMRQLAIFLGLAAIVVDAPALVVMRTLQGLGDARRYKIGALLRVIVYALLIAVLAFDHLNPVDVVMAYITSDVVCFCYAALALRRLLAEHRSHQPKPGYGSSRPRLVGDILVPSLRAQLAVLSLQGSYRTDLVLLGFLAPASVVGQYAFATSIAEILWVLAEAISLSLYSTTVRLMTEGDEQSAHVALRRALRVQFETAAVGMIFVSAISYPLIHIAFHAYTPAYPLIIVLLPGIVVGGAARLVTSSAIASERARLVRRCALISLGLTPVYVPCILIDQAMGAAIASDIIYVLTVVLFLHAYRTLSPARVPDRTGPAAV
jgi:O-antigen/teichoic acid export membrane protein